MIPNRKPDVGPRERRRHQRVSIALLGRYMLGDRTEYPCQTIDMSPGGVALSAPVSPALGSRVIAYLDHIGRVEGAVARLLPRGFALALTMPLLKRDKIGDQLTWLANSRDLGLPEDRRHERIVPRNAGVMLKLADGRNYQARLIDVSQSGAALACPAPLAYGAAVRLGTTPARVVRVFDGGCAVEFTGLVPADRFGEDLTL